MPNKSHCVQVEWYPYKDKSKLLNMCHKRKQGAVNGLGKGKKEVKTADTVLCVLYVIVIFSLLLYF